jgi:hypothetical protein
MGRKLKCPILLLKKFSAALRKNAKTVEVWGTIDGIPTKPMDNQNDALISKKQKRNLVSWQNNIQGRLNKNHSIV